MEVIAALLARPDLFDGPLRTDLPSTAAEGEGVGIGWVDGPRGLLVHRYRAASDGRVAAAVVLTPTAQNEYWLSHLLRQAVGAGTGASSRADLGLEDAIREADPCLPCSSAPAGAMGLVVEETTSVVRHDPAGGR
ncbi:hypothetical protein [Raineyella fluvialis]|uniref:Uncharacterized protein n=1 Tax=Raineyella fluvialis TaxID=2662261 RepID=A0A5Q2F8E5_9ACTN|nr:hypothetical protein [Raineyella fluvialis]QGF23099.1 hypothetical protein Rai3103_04815 [Raineyella fluvialis]